MKVKITSILHILCMCMVGSLFLENIKLFDIVGAQFKPTHVIFIFSIVFALIYKKKIVLRRNILPMLFFLLLPVFPLYRINDIMEWIKSYFVWTIIVLYFGIAFPTFYKIFQKKRCEYIKYFIYGMIIVQILAIAQFIIMNFTGTMFLENVFGKYQFSESFTSIKGKYYRAYSIYHEPSFLGLMNSTGLACVFYTKREKILSPNVRELFYLLCTITMFVSISAVAMYCYIIIVAAYLLMTYRNKYSFYGLLILTCVAIYLSTSTDLLQPLTRISVEYNKVDSSGYERLNTPMQYAKLTLDHYPVLGRGIGQAGNVDAVGTISTAITKTANNSILEVIVNFGLSSVSLCGLFVQQSIRRIKQDRLFALIILNLICVLFSTGAYLSLDFLAILNFSFFLFKK